MIAAPRGGARPHLDALTSLRFVAAAMIVLQHLRGMFGIPQDVGDPFVLDHGVAFFFVLSGFVLTYSYPSLEVVGAKRFLQARIARIWPAHLTTLLMVFALFRPSARSADPQYSMGQLAANAALIHGWIPLRGFYFSFNAVSWSISTELGFYLCFPFIIRNWRQTWARKLVVGFLLAAAMITIANSLPEMETGLTYVNPLARLLEFMIGMAAALWWETGGSRMRVTAGTGTLLEVGAIGLAGISMYFSVPAAIWVGPWVGSAGTAWLLHGGIVCVPFAVLIVVMALDAGVISRVLTFSVPVFLGEISYSVYLIHQLLTRYYWQHARALSPVPSWPALIVFLALLVLLAHLMWLLIETPARRFLVHAPHIQPARPTITQGRTWREMSWQWIAGETVALLSVVLLVGYVALFRPSIVIVDNSHADRVRRQSMNDLRDVQFGRRLVLRGVEITRTSQDVLLELTWQSLAPQRLRSKVLVHILDDQSRILNQADYEQDTAHSEVPAGELWCDHINLSPDLLGGAHTIAIGFYGSGSNDLVADRGPRDWDNRRLLIPLTPVSATFSTGFHPQESDQIGVTWRWMGQDGMIRLKNTHRDMRLTIKGLVPREIPQAATISLDLNGERLDTIREVRGEIQRQYLVTAERQGGDEWSMLHLTTSQSFVPHERDPQSPDMRRLGFAVYEASWETK